MQQALEREAQIDQKTAAPAPCRGQHINARHAIAQGKPRLTDRLIDNVRMRSLLHFAAQSGHEAQVIVHKGQAPERP